MSNKRGQKKMSGMTIFIMVFVLAILGAVFIQSIADSTTSATTILTVTNGTLTSPAVNSTVNLNGKLVTDFIAYNATGDPAQTIFNGTDLLGAGNYSLSNNVQDATGQHTALYKTLDNGFVGNLNVSYNYQPLGYVSSSGGRTITNLVLVMFAIGLLLFVGSKLFNTDKFRRIMGVRR